jgi:hypothetical protein
MSWGARPDTYGPEPVKCSRCGCVRTKAEHLEAGKCRDWGWCAKQAGKATGGK